MNIKSIPIFEIQRAKYNPRKTLKPGDPAYDRLKKAVTTFGLVEPLVWNSRTKNLVGGHQRLTVLEETGASHVDVSVVDLDDRAEKALNLALNRHSGEWDFASLADMLQELDAGEMDWDVTGFSADDLEKLMTYQAPTVGLTDEDAIPETTPAVTKPGDLWILGAHRLLCGDCTTSADVARLLGDLRPGLMVTDPPYGVNYDPKWRLDAGINKPHQTRAEGIVANDNRADWREAYALFNGGIAYVWHGGLHAAIVADGLMAAGFGIRSQIIWAKPSLVIGRGHYHWQHEPCWYAVKANGIADWSGDRKQSTLWTIPNMHRTQGNVDDGKNNHSTQKPVECMRRPINNHTNPGQAVYDPFVGSGTTIIAAESTGRVCYAIDIDPVYVDVAVKRWEDFTGKKAELAS